MMMVPTSFTLFLLFLLVLAPMGVVSLMFVPLPKLFASLVILFFELVFLRA